MYSVLKTILATGLYDARSRALLVALGASLGISRREFEVYENLFATSLSGLEGNVSEEIADERKQVQKSDKLKRWDMTCPMCRFLYIK